MTPGEHLCSSCGLCCDGTLFTRVPLATSDDVPTGLRITTTATQARYLAQPCQALEGTLCRCYAERPLVCRRFECLLLLALKSGEVGLDEARQMVVKARSLEKDDQRRYLAFHFHRPAR